MKRYLPIIIVLVVLLTIGTELVSRKNRKSEIDDVKGESKINIGTFDKTRSCIKMPKFLKKLHIVQPVIIDLSQQQYKGLALLYGKQMEKVLHLKSWERYEYFSTYALDRRGNIFLIPMPLISIRPTTFSLQKNLYKLDTKTGKIDPS